MNGNPFGRHHPANHDCTRISPTICEAIIYKHAIIIRWEFEAREKKEKMVSRLLKITAAPNDIWNSHSY